MTKLLYLTDSYKKETRAKVIEIVKKGDHHYVILDATVCYPEGGGQPSDRGEITGKNGSLEVTHVRMFGDQVLHEGKLTGKLAVGEDVSATIDWDIRLNHMRWHSAGHVVHEVVMQTVSGLTPIRGEHGKHAFIEYKGHINPKLTETIEKRVNMLVAENRKLTTEFVTLEELKKRAAWVPEKLPQHKPLRILTVEGFPPIPDGGTQIKNTSELGTIKIIQVEQLGIIVRVHYAVSETPHIRQNLNKHPKRILKHPSATLGKGVQNDRSMTLDNFRVLLLELQNEILNQKIDNTTQAIENLKIYYFGTRGKATQLIRHLSDLPQTERKTAGLLVNEFKKSATAHFEKRSDNIENIKPAWFDVSLPGKKPPVGHLHIVTQAIMEITRIFERIGFLRVRHPEVDWDYYPFESLNMPANHPARDEWETFFIESSKFKVQSSKFSKIVLTPHTSNGQVREMEKGKLPIRMINIAKCYRRQSDVSHVPMFHQFEGLYVDKNVSIGHLSGVFDYFVKQFYGSQRKTRLRPFHFQFTEPSFEVDINCGICLGKGCKLCKEGWLELGGSGMVHPNVLRAGGIDPDKYSGFAFGWGIERTYMMKSGTKIDDVRLLYSNDIRFLEQF